MDRICRRRGGYGSVMYHHVYMTSLLLSLQRSISICRVEIVRLIEVCKEETGEQGGMGM